MKKAVLSMAARILEKRIQSKFKTDRIALPLSLKDYKLYKAIHVYYYAKLHAFPNLQNPESFNDKVQWLKLFGQDVKQIDACDKILVKERVRDLIGPEFIIPTISKYATITPKNIKDELVYKCSHDSGSTFIGSGDKNYIAKQLNYAVARPFGIESGEWAYSHVSPRILGEERLPGDNMNIVDYKFFCVEGVPKFCHIIYGRQKNAPREVLVDLKGREVPVALHPKFKYGSLDRLPEKWDEMVQIAEELARGYKMVRVDLYCEVGSVFFGELTFWPQSGTYRGEGQKYWGSWLDFSLDANPPCFSVRS